ncbi:ABC transporter periplasmic component [Dietzia sp. NCCP-2495]|uniref:ABC transporter substrate-binding protein n=1 Tax=Dietzia sp. NCCP-2495 TaxID=2934675 RepID=UPI0022315381|nr:ABC transporter substrate-binding protein [Dietzia sp. NCCP-2495]GLB64849.1 ABC transporter periplasmic component [Dietzia sp. NCCP-2495]
MSRSIGRRTVQASLAVLTAGAVGLAGCAEPESTESATAEGSSGATGEITLYTSEPQAKIDQIIAAFNEEQPGIEVNVFRAGTGDLKARIEAERSTGAVAADILLAADVPTFEAYKDEDLLREYEPAEADALEEFALDPDGYYVGTRVIPTVIAYNTNDVTEPPTSWAALTEPEYKDRIVLPNPDVSGAAAFNAAAWSLQPELGSEWIQALGANSPQVAESNGPVAQAVAEGARSIGIVVDYLVRDLAAKGSPIAVSYPEEGVPYITQPGAIFADAPNPEAAELFLDFIVSKTGQELAVEQSYLPVRDDAGSPEGAPAMADITLFDQDLDEIAASKESAVAAFNEAVR